MFRCADAPGIDVEGPGCSGMSPVAPGLSILRAVVDSSRQCREDHSDNQDEEEGLSVEGERLLKLLPDFVGLLFF